MKRYIKNKGYDLITAILVIILFLIMAYCCSGCTDKVYYKYVQTDPNGVVVRIEGYYTEGMGNHEKQGVDARIEDHIQITVGNSITDQSELMELMNEQTQLLRTLLITTGM